jgi:hypothetical protein
MTNEELDKARSDEAYRMWLEEKGYREVVGIIAARLAREGWTPPVAVDPDLAEARTIYHNSLPSNPMGMALAGIKRGRELERQKARSENNYKIKIKWEDTPEEAAARKRGMLEQFVTIKPEDAA